MFEKFHECSICRFHGVYLMIATPQTSGGGGVSAFGVELGEASTLGPGTPLSPGSTGPGTKKTGPVGPGLQCLDPSDIGGTHLFQELPANESMHLLRRWAAPSFVGSLEFL